MYMLILPLMIPISLSITDPQRPLIRLFLWPSKPNILSLMYSSMIMGMLRPVAGMMNSRKLDHLLLSLLGSNIGLGSSWGKQFNCTISGYWYRYKRWRRGISVAV
ncbi:hypothetical protein FPQ18DRAFT_313818 [Pyronema domesticum]|nr:hypothetical protein FPQ18DRAFT_313818 [Pyronema domesticum]